MFLLIDGEIDGVHCSLLFSSERINGGGLEIT